MTPHGIWAQEAEPGSVNAAFVETLGAAIILVVPGYVLGRVAGRAGREPDATDRGMAVRLAADSILVHTVTMPFTFLLADSVLRHGAAGYGAQIFCWLIAVCLLVPVALGGCGLWLIRRDPKTVWGRLAAVLGFSPTNRFVHAWSAMLAELPRQPEGLLARVRLRDGAEVTGFFTRWGRASDDPARHDLFLDEVLTINPLSEYYPYSGGIWLNGDDIVTVEFFLARERPRPSKEKSVTEQRKPEQTPGHNPKPHRPGRIRARGSTGDPMRPASGAEQSTTTQPEPAAKPPVPRQPRAERGEAGR